MAAETTELVPARVFEYPTMTKTAKDGFKLKVAEGEFRDSEIIVLLGAHGTGKTTFLRMMKGYLVPDTVHGFYQKYYAAYKSQTMLRPYPHTVEEMLRWEIDDATMDPLFVTHVMEPLQIQQLMDRTIDDLSREETQRLSLCMCLGKRAHIYLIDEPSAHLSPEQRDVASTVIRNFVTLFNKTVFVAEHDFTMVERLADKVIVFEGTPSVDCVANAPQPWNLFLAGGGQAFWD